MQVSKICYTHGKLCYSDQQVLPCLASQGIAEISFTRRLSIPKTFLRRNIPILLLLCSLITLNLEAFFQRTALSKLEMLWSKKQRFGIAENTELSGRQHASFFGICGAYKKGNGTTSMGSLSAPFEVFRAELVGTKKQQ